MWHKGASNLHGLLVITVVKCSYALFTINFKDSANGRCLSLFAKQMAKYTRKP